MHNFYKILHQIKLPDSIYTTFDLILLLQVYIHIRRKTIQHVFNIVIPCIVLSIICMVGFLIPPDKIDEKISVQLTVLFSLSLFMLLVAESTPRTSESVPLISMLYNLQHRNFVWESI